jgi:hypothetical protein
VGFKLVCKVDGNSRSHGSNDEKTVRKVANKESNEDLYILCTHA